jgi:archaellin
MQQIRSVIGYVFIVFCYCCVAQATESETTNANLTIHFPGLSSVHTEVRISDGQAGSASGEITKKLRYKTDSVTTELAHGLYDLVINKGHASLIIDDVKCESANCTVNVPLATLTVNFPELSSVHTSVRVTDGMQGIAEGGESTKANWKKHHAVIVLLQGTYDLLVRNGASSQIIDNVRCMTATCAVELPLITMTINFPGLSSVHSSIRLADNITNSATGEQVSKANWKRDQTQVLLFPGVYDLFVRYGASSQIIDAVNCEAGDCQIDLPVSNLTVEFPGLSSVHTYVKNTDGVDNSASGEQVTKAKWKKNQAKMLVFPGTYDLEVNYGKSSHIIDNVNCENGDCRVKLLMATLTVDFPGLSKVHTYVKNTDGANGTASGEQIAKATWKTDKAELLLLPGLYDLLIEFGGSSQVIDNVDCTAERCQVDLSMVNLTVDFPDLKGVHTYVMKTDGQSNTASGDQVTKAKWKTDQAQMTVLPGVYDLLIEYGASTQIIDNVDCSKAHARLMFHWLI